jgi:hypothetical protein
MAAMPRRRAGVKAADHLRRSHEVRLLNGQPRDAPHVKGEHGHQHAHVEQRQVALEGQPERVQRGRQQDHKLKPVAWFEVDVASSKAQVRQHDHHRPGDANQESVGAGHVGDRVAGVSRILGRQPGITGVYDVLGQDGDERQQRERQALREIELYHLGDPREQ